MNMAYRQKDLYGNSFSYTLFDLSLQRKFFVKRLFFGVAIATSLSLIGYGIYKLNKK